METVVPILIAVAALAVVMLPVLRERTADAGLDEAVLDSEVRRYRAALRERTLCARCSEANPTASRFCARCGAGLAE